MGPQQKNKKPVGGARRQQEGVERKAAFQDECFFVRFDVLKLLVGAVSVVLPGSGRVNEPADACM